MSSKFRSKSENLFYIYFLDYIVRKLEEKIGVDLNGDGQVGGPGMSSKLEQATHVDFNRDGVIGYRPPAGGGKD
jgi:hypothetical protein